MAELAVLLVSVAILARASSTVIDAAAKLAGFFRISQMAIGLLLMAVATTLPELSVSVISSAVGEGAIAAGNAFGSTIANILLILGLGGFAYGIRISASNLRDIGLVLLLTTAISVYIVFSSTVQGRALGFGEGLVLLAAFAAYTFFIIKGKRADGDADNQVTKREAMIAFLIFCGGIVAVLISSALAVQSAVAVARTFGVAESFIGSTIIAMGTSLPELTLTLQSLRKKQYGLALGDAIGANMSNMTLVIGTAAVINPIYVMMPVFITTLLFAVLANMMLLYFAAVNKRIKKYGGALFMLAYAAYIATIFFVQLGELGSA